MLFLNQSNNEDYDAGTYNTADDIAKDAAEGNTDKIKDESTNETANNTKNDVNQKAMATLHDIARKPSADSTDDK